MSYTIMYTKVLRNTTGQKVERRVHTTEGATSLQLDELFAEELPRLAEEEALYIFGVQFDDGSDGYPVIDRAPEWVYRYVNELTSAAYNALLYKGAVQIDLEALSISMRIDETLMNDNFIIIAS